MPKTTLSLEFPPGYKKWEEEELCQFLQDCQKTLKDRKITAVMLQNLTYAEQEELGMSITELQSKEQGKMFNDPIHGHVELHPLLVRIINTPQFNRLRNIKQLGGAYFVFPGACHNRFEHSIGVAHLAGELARALKTNQPELNITDRDILCVQIAGLCHDLGHGPFSHLFDGMFIPRARPGKKWMHEEASLKMFDHMVKENDLKKVMAQYGLEPDQDIHFIKEMIKGIKMDEEWKFKGRGQDKSFLYEIVANKTNGIDVDKFDYFARDCHHLGIQNHFDHHRFFLFARVCEVDGKKHICSRDKEVHNLYDMFYARCSFHRKAYQHKTKNLIETMITDAFLKADEFIQIEGSEGKKFTLSEAIDDMEAYTKLTDRVFEDILNSSSPGLKDARQILNRIINRDLNKCVGKVETETKKITEDLIEKWKKELVQAKSTQKDGLKPEDFAIVVTTLDYGMKDDDPISRVYFYSKHDPTKAFRIPPKKASKLLPERFSEQFIRIYCKKTDDKSLEAAEKHFKQWCDNKGFPALEDGDQGEHSQQ